ncbi:MULTISPECIES: GntR family transcriptional regulator [Vibrio]|uniref:GntR family transcriptional regulator n=1 Tax=Vibrio TaxID=662 RepID=UPI003D1125FF
MKTSKHKAMAYLTRDILNQTIAPNERLVTQDLSNRYGLGLSPIREATQELASMGFVDYKPNIGAYVTPLTAIELRSLIQFLIFHFDNFSSPTQNSPVTHEEVIESDEKYSKQHAEVIIHFIQLKQELNNKDIQRVNAIIIEDHFIALLSLLRNQHVAKVVDLFFDSVLTNLRRYIRLYIMHDPKQCSQLLPINTMEQIMVAFTQDNHLECAELVVQYLEKLLNHLLPAFSWDSGHGITISPNTRMSGDIV